MVKHVAALLLWLMLHVAAGDLLGSSDFTSTVPPAPITNGAAPNILVLGSGGLVGSALVQELRRRGYGVLEAKDRMHHDLRVKGSLKLFDSVNISFCFFLACEVGGSKFIASGANERAIWRNNEKMYDNVFPYLEERKIPFLFTSSQLSVTGTAYGKIKAVGEDLITNMTSKLGKFVRFWNVWGAEKIGLKSHILADWVYQCVKFGHVASHTSGLEQRQFVHAADMASALLDIMMKFSELPVRIDITSGEWVSMRQIASILADHSPEPCTFTFAERNSSTMIGIEPQFLWTVSSDLHRRVHETFRYYEALVHREAHAQRDPAPYLSIIICTTNDDYNGIRGRTYNFIQGLVTQAELSHLNYELIVTQYNPRVPPDAFKRDASAAGASITADTFVNDLSFSQLFPWTSETSFGRVRVITVPNHLHRWPEKGAFWEYVGKNAGAWRAHGQFFLITNPDDVFPITLIEQLSKQQLDPKKIYKAGVVLNFKGHGPLQGVLGACNEIAASMYGAVAPAGDGFNFLPSDELQQSAAKYTNPAHLWGEGKPDWRQLYVGDYSLWHRDVFLSTSGYLEFPQNTHVETAHLVALVTSPAFAAAGLSVAFMDDIICHQDHTRNGRPAAPHDHLAVAAMMANRTDRLTSGLRTAELPEARMHNIFDAGYNPESPFLLYPHHHLFRMFQGNLWAGKVRQDYITDFLGILTAYSFDCTDFEGIRFSRLSVRIPCARHEEYLRNNYTASELPAMGDLPIIDEEYFGWLALLHAIKSKLRQPRNNPFVAAELGTRYGAWTARAGAAIRVLQPFRPLHLLTLEEDLLSFQRLQAHVRVNRLAHVTQTVRGAITYTRQPGNASAYTLKQLFSNYDHIDMLHCDLESVGSFIGAMPLLNEKVGAIHFTTHGTAAHDDLVKAFAAAGWKVVRSMQPSGSVAAGRVEETSVGPIRMLSRGVLAVDNPRQLRGWSSRMQVATRTGHSDALQN